MAPWFEVSRPLLDFLLKMKLPIYVGRAIDTNVSPPNEAFCISATEEGALNGAKHLEKELLRRRGVVYHGGEVL